MESAVATKQRKETRVWTSRPYTILSWEYVAFLLRRNLTFYVADEVSGIKFERFDFVLNCCSEFWNLYSIDAQIGFLNYLGDRSLSTSII